MRRHLAAIVAYGIRRRYNPRHVTERIGGQNVVLLYVPRHARDASGQRIVTSR